jgi:precorrin-2 dehydrogenase
LLPLILDLSRLRLALIGAGEPVLRRLEKLDAAGAAAGLAVFAPAAPDGLEAAAGARLARRWPEDAELARAQIVFVAGLDPVSRDRIAARARACGAIVQVEDAPAVSDAASAAVLRRGDLTIAVSTSGKSPAFAAYVARLIGRILGPEWVALLAAASRHRRQWRQAGLPPSEVARRTGEWLAQGAGPVSPHP